MGKRRKVEIEVVAAEAAALPFVCYFPTGTPSSAQSRDDDGIEFTMYTKAGEKTQGRNSNIVVGSRESMDYVGTSTSAEYAGFQPCSYAVGVYDKASGKLQLLPMQGGKVSRMEARLHGIDYGPAGLTGTDGQTREEKLAMNKRLVDSFGSTRRRRQLNAREEGIVRTEKLTSTGALTQVLQDGAQAAHAQGLSKAQVLQRVTQVRNLPPHHPEARTAGEAYRLDELIPAGAHDCLDVGRLYSAAESTEACQKLRSNNVVPEYVLSRLYLLRDPDRSKCKHRARILAFLGALLTLHGGKPSLRVDPERGGMDTLAERCRMKPELLQELLELFYNRRREGNMELYERPDQKRELLLAYVLVLVQLLEGGGLAAPQFEALRQELKMKPTDLVQRFREVGSTCLPTTFKAEDSEGEAASTRSYNVVLLKDGSKTLGETFPGIKMGPKKK